MHVKIVLSSLMSIHETVQHSVFLALRILHFHHLNQIQYVPILMSAVRSLHINDKKKLSLLTNQLLILYGQKVGTTCLTSYHFTKTGLNFTLSF